MNSVDAAREVDQFLRACHFDMTEKLCPLSSPEGIGIGSVIELAVWLSRATEGPALTHLRTWLDFRMIEQVAGLFRKGEGVLSLAENLKAFRVSNRELSTDRTWNDFLITFRRILKNAGFVNGLDGALAGVLEEMVNNVVEHSSFGSEDDPIRGLAAYFVEKGRMVFAIADGGQGVLESLRKNPDWNHLRNSREGLDAIARSQASRKASEMGGGEGFRELFETLVSFDGFLRLRSGNGVFEMTGRLDRSQAIARTLSDLPGLQITAECRI